MSTKEIVHIGTHEKEIIDFLERVRAAGQLRVKLRDDVLLVKVSSDTVTEKGRAFLTKGGPIEK